MIITSYMPRESIFKSRRTAFMDRKTVSVCKASRVTLSAHLSILLARLCRVLDCNRYSGGRRVWTFRHTLRACRSVSCVYDGFRAKSTTEKNRLYGDRPPCRYRSQNCSRYDLQRVLFQLSANDLAFAREGKRGHDLL